MAAEMRAPNTIAAREAGLVKDRLRLKDATHMLADVANVQPLQLAAQVRERLLNAAQPLFADWVAEQRVNIERLRQTTAESPMASPRLVPSPPVTKTQRLWLVPQRRKLLAGVPPRDCVGAICLRVQGESVASPVGAIPKRHFEEKRRCVLLMTHTATLAIELAA